MSVETVRRYLRQWGKDGDILEFPVSSATVALAAEALGVIPGRIAKSLTFHGAEGGCILLVAAGDARVANGPFRAQFGCKAKMLSPEEAADATGYAVGGVCPFGIQNPAVSIYLDASLRRFETVYPACGSSNSAIELTLAELETMSHAAGWVDVCKDWQEVEDHA